MNQPLFVNARGRPLTRFGVRYLLRKYVVSADRTVVSLREKRIHTHSIRHATAVCLLKSGIDFATISQWLGHVLCLFRDVTNMVLSLQSMRGFTQNLALKSMCGGVGIE